MAETKKVNHIEEFEKIIKRQKDNASLALKDDMEKVHYCIKRIGKIDAQYADIKQNNIDAFNFYFGRQYMLDVDGRSKVYTTDVAQLIEWLMPALMREFASDDDVAKLSPLKEQNAQQVANHNELINYQLKVKNNWFKIINDWFRDALLLKRGIVKYQWYKHTENEERKYEDLTEAEFMEVGRDPNVKKIEDVAANIVTPETMIGMPDMESGLIRPVFVPPVKTYNCTVQYEYEEEQPLIEPVPVSECGFPMMTRDIEDCTFFWHRVKYYKWDFIKRYGEAKWNRIKDLRDRMFAVSDDQVVEEQRFADVGGGVAYKFFYDEDDDDWYVYECYFINPDNGRPWIRSICGNVILEDRRNEYGKPPFRLLTPVKLAHRIVGVSIFDLVKDLQRIRTSLFRQFLDNTYFNNNGRWLLNPMAIDYNAFINGNRPGGVAVTKDGMPATEDAVRPLPVNPMHPQSFEVFEMVNREKDYAGGLPRSYQGTNPQLLNRTMRGQNQQVQLAVQRIELMARLFAEMGIAPLVRDVADMNKRFMKKATALKVVNNWIEVTPNDASAKADVIINVGLGTTNKDTRVTQNQQMIALYMQLYPIFGQSLNPKILHAMEELVKAMGYRDVQNWVPDSQEALKAALQMQALQLAQQGTATQKGQPMPSQGNQPAAPGQPNMMIPDIWEQYFG